MVAHSKSPQRMEKLPRFLKWVGAATAVITLLLGAHQLYGWVRNWQVRRTEVKQLVNASQLRRESGEYAEAWKLSAQALERDPESQEAQDEQLTDAMDWVRNIRLSSARGEKSFSDVVDKLTPILSRSAATAQGKTKANLLAHLGWADFLRWRDGIRGIAVDSSYKNALSLDPENRYAHAMWGHWILYPGGGAGNLQEAAAHFAAALKAAKTPQELQYVRQLQMSALLNNYDRYALEIIRLADEMRTSGESIEPNTRQRILTYAYGELAPGGDARLTVIAAADHLKTFQWLVQGIDIEHNASLRLWRARLTEATGDSAQALALNRRLLLDFPNLLPKTKLEIEQAVRRLSATDK